MFDEEAVVEDNTLVLAAVLRLLALRVVLRDGVLAVTLETTVAGRLSACTSTDATATMLPVLGHTCSRRGNNYYFSWKVGFSLEILDKANHGGYRRE